MPERRAANKDARRQCQLWDATDAKPWEACPVKPDGTPPTALEAAATAALQPSERCTACVALPAKDDAATGEKGCDAACQASTTAAKHSVWACQKAGECLATRPGDAADQAKPEKDRVWRADDAVVDRKGAKTGGAQDAQGANYKVAEAGLAAPVREVACVDFQRALAGKGEPALLTRLAAPDATSKDPKVADVTKEVLYVCSKGRAYQCQAPAAPAGGSARRLAGSSSSPGAGSAAPGAGSSSSPGAGSSTSPGAAATPAPAVAGAQDATACLKDAQDDPALSPQAGGAPKWRLVAGAVGRLEPKHEERWPDCLATAPWACADAAAAPGSCDGSPAKPLATKDAAQAAEFRKRLSDAPLATLVELTEPVPAAGGKPATTRGSGKFVRGPDLPVVVDARGALCTNLAGKLKPAAGSTQSADTKVAAAPDALAGYLQAVGDATLDPAARKAWRALQVVDQAGLAKALADPKTLGAWPSVRAVVAQLPEKLYDVLTKGADAKLKLTYWDFLGAVAVAPAFCTTKGSGQLAGLGATAVCARELAALWALGAANSNGLEAEAGKAATPKQGTTWAEQGWKKAKDARCDLPQADLAKQP